MEIIVGGIIEKDNKILMVKEAKRNVMGNGMSLQDIQKMEKQYLKGLLEKYLKKLDVKSD